MDTVNAWIKSFSAESDIPQDAAGHIKRRDCFEEILTNPLHRTVYDMLSDGFDSYEIGRHLKRSKNTIEQVRTELRHALSETPEFKNFVRDINNDWNADYPTATFPTPEPSQNLKDLQRRIIFEFHEANISLRRKIETRLFTLKRGAKGGLLSSMALNILPADIASKIKAVIAEKDVMLVYLDSMVLTIPSEYIRFVK